jgi:sortase A
MKKLIIAVISVCLMVSMSVPAFAAEYTFSSGDNAAAFGKATTYNEAVAPNPEMVNERRSKDAALLPPPFGYFGGDIPTDPSSPYHDNSKNSGGFVDGAVYVAPDAAPGTSNITVSAPIVIAPAYYADGSIGSIYIPRFSKTIKVYEGESLENMKKGIGHFTATSAWDGNVGAAGHNRGAAAYFSFVKDLAIGDVITYTTRYGVRTYEIYRKDKIAETDFSSLGWSAENIITLITCVEDVPALRWCVQARQIL